MDKKHRERFLEAFMNVNGEKVKEIITEGKLVHCGSYPPIRVYTTEAQTEYLLRKLEVLKKQFMEIELRKAFRSFMINLTYTIQENKIKSFIAGASVAVSLSKSLNIMRLNAKDLKIIVADKRVEKMIIFQGVNHALTAEELKQYKHIWENFAESRPLHNMSEGSTLIESHGCYNNSSMVIEIITSESNCHQLTVSVNQGPCEVTSLMNTKSGYRTYFGDIHNLGFNHIILVRKQEFGIIFLDCYG
ncbi:hypothetical protein C1646_763371 [Rhizophagus diaphanus]|nr:hypothetical protein C1646_763371 [Rhizophagus diaphanus] [Rhizophagus sp. MUCL 43196]